MQDLDTRLQSLLDDDTRHALSALDPLGARREGVALLRSLDLLAVDVIKGLVIDAVQKANSGHPGGPLSSVDFAYVLWKDFLKISPDPAWLDRDRFVLSGGHMSMLLYSLLYYTGRVTMADLQRFRQLGSPTQGHPVRGLCPGVETSTGPLGQGFANGVGMALAEEWLRRVFGSGVVDHHTYVLATDGDIQEGVCREAASLAGHMKLGRLVVFFDSNAIQLASPTAKTTTEDIAGAFRAMEWNVLELTNGHDHAALGRAIRDAKAQGARPTIIIGRTMIARGTTKEGLVETHGAPLGDAVIQKFKQARQHPERAFWDPPFVKALFQERLKEGACQQAGWENRLAELRQKRPELAEAFDVVMGRSDAAAFARRVTQALGKVTFEGKSTIATRNAGGDAMAALAPAVPHLLGGSADLCNSTKTDTFEKAVGYFPEAVQEGAFKGRGIYFGVREHAMGSIANGLALHGGILPYTGTFLAFADYMRPAIRLAAISHVPCTFIFTHDSILLGEDGETHQPVEQLSALRMIPRLAVLRPADAHETVAAWQWVATQAMGAHPRPVCLVLSRQNLPVLHANRARAMEKIGQGAYALTGADDPAPHVQVLATGSEVALALEGARLARERHGLVCRVISVPSLELFLEQDESVRDAVLLPSVPLRVAIEAASPHIWSMLVGQAGEVIGMTGFGESAPDNQLAQKYGFTPEAICERLRLAVERFARRAPVEVRATMAHLARIAPPAAADAASLMSQAGIAPGREPSATRG